MQEGPERLCHTVTLNRGSLEKCDGHIGFLLIPGLGFSNPMQWVLLFVALVALFLIGRRWINHRRRTTDLLQTVAPAAMAQAKTGVVITDAEGKILYINRSFQEMTGFAARDLIGATPQVFAAGAEADTAGGLGRLWSVVQAGREYRTRGVSCRKDGSAFPTESTVSPVYCGGEKPTYYVFQTSERTSPVGGEMLEAELAVADPVTGLPGSRLLRERSRQVLALARRHGSTAALVHLRVDGPLAGNGTVSRELIDGAFIVFAERMQQNLRESDVLARLDDQTFVILLSEVNDAEAIARLASRLRKAVAEPYAVNGQTIELEVRLGIALFPQDATTLDELIRHSEQSMQRAVASGTPFEFFSPAMSDHARDRLRLEDDLFRASEGDEIVLHYQPIVALTSDAVVGAEALARGQTIGVEALARWPHADKGLLAAHEFIPLAERSGQIVALDRWALTAATRQAADWSRDGWNAWVSVNLSARSVNDLELPGYIQRTLALHGFEPERLVVEITESAALRDLDTTIEVLQRLKALGVRIAIDDFGAGQSSLAYLKYFPLDYIKLDRGFVRDLMTDPRDEHLVEAMISLAHRLGAMVIAEGVEAEEQYEWLKRNGCDMIQGFLVGQPGPPHSLKTTVS